MSSITLALLGPAARSGVASRVGSLSHDLAPTQIVLQRLVARIARGDEGALRQFRAVTTPQVSSSVRVLLTDSADVEEVLSHVILQVWRCARLYYSARGSVSRWLFLLVRSRAMDRRRQNAVAA